MRADFGRVHFATSPVAPMTGSRHDPTSIEERPRLDGGSGGRPRRRGAAAQHRRAAGTRRPVAGISVPTMRANDNGATTTGVLKLTRQTAILVNMKGYYLLVKRCHRTK